LTGLLLKSELVSEQGKALEQIVYTNIRLPAHIPDDLLAPAISGEGYTWYSNDYPVSRTASTRPGDQWVVTWVPKGFEVSDRIYDPSSVSRNPVEHLVYSDGLAKMSVFIELLDDAKESLLGPSGMGAINAYGSVIGDYQVTVVGEVPEITVEKVGQSVRRR
jgi:sigma-E factor negative regulatory protein RseB